jgi:hypothetical protein
VQAEAEKVLREVSQVKNVTDSRGRLVTKAKRYLKNHERRSRQDELDHIGQVLDKSNWAQATMTAEGRQLLAKRRRALEDQLEDGTPPQVSGETKDVLSKRLQELNETMRIGMPTVEEMRRNPAGAVDKHRRWEAANKVRKLERDNVLHLLNPDDDSKDLTNIEMIRPSGLIPGGASTFMADAQIPGHFAMTPLAKENWPLGEAKVDNPLAQAARRELDEQEYENYLRLKALEEDLNAKKERERERGRKLGAAQKAAAAARLKKAEIEAFKSLPKDVQQKLRDEGNAPI